MPLQATSGAASYDGFGGGVAVEPVYIEQIFSTYLYTGNGTSQTITNGIDLSTKGGLVWEKPRNAVGNNYFVDTARGGNYSLYSDTTNAQLSGVGLTFNSNGYTWASSWGTTINVASWTFRKQPKFFDVVTYTGNGAASRQIAHNLGSVPGCIILKRTNTATDWWVYHRSTGLNKLTRLNTTGAADITSLFPAVSSTSFQVDAGPDNNTGDTYVAYLFAHDAGGFGLTGTDNVISCGSYTGNGSNDGPTITLGYEPQWLLIKDSTTAKNWQIFDNMRGMVVGLYNSDSDDAALQPNLSNAESLLNGPRPNATGFSVGGSAQINTNASTYIYIAIRRGPMKVPTSGTSVFSPVAYTGNQSTSRLDVDAGFVVDAGLFMNRPRTDYTTSMFTDRLRGAEVLSTNSTAAASSVSGYLWFDDQNGIDVGQIGDLNPVVAGVGQAMVLEAFRRAPSFFDEVCWSNPSGNAITLNHNLGVVPELIIAKRRDVAQNWVVGATSQGWTKAAYLNLTNAFGNDTAWNNSSPTSTQFQTNVGATNFVAYLFATCAGVSKVGSYTGNGSSQTINCGFTGGARFVLIKRTDSTGDWYVWDTARGIVTANDPHLSLNTTAAEVTTDDTIDTNSTGFIVNQVTATNVNVSSATYIFLAIA